jgi:hypothetical protein
MTAINIRTNGSTSPLDDRVVVDLLDELEFALAVLEATERRSRSPGGSARLTNAALAVDAAIIYLRELRG